MAKAIRAGSENHDIWLERLAQLIVEIRSEIIDIDSRHYAKLKVGLESFWRLPRYHESKRSALDGLANGPWYAIYQ